MNAAIGVTPVTGTTTTAAAACASSDRQEVPSATTVTPETSAACQRRCGLRRCRLYNLSYQRGCNPDFVSELHALLTDTEEADDGRCGISWDPSGTAVVLTDPPLFQKRILRRRQFFLAESEDDDDDEDEGDDDDGVHKKESDDACPTCTTTPLEEWHDALRDLGFSLSATAQPTQPAYDESNRPRRYSHPKFRRDSTLKELSRILPKKIRKKTKKDRRPQETTARATTSRPTEQQTKGSDADGTVASKRSDLPMMVERETEKYARNTVPDDNRRSDDTHGSLDSNTTPPSQGDTFASTTEAGISTTTKNRPYGINNKVTDDEDDESRDPSRINLDRIVLEWKEQNAKNLRKEWNSWHKGEISFMEQKPRLWCPASALRNKRVVLVLLSGRGNATTVDELAKFTPQLRRETARCLVLEKLMSAQVHTLDKRIIKENVVSRYYHQGDVNDLRRLASEGLLRKGRFDEIVMDYVWWENAYVQDRITGSFFRESIPKLLQTCKPRGSIFLPCTPYIFSQTVLSVLKGPDDRDLKGDHEDEGKSANLDDRDKIIEVALLTQEDAANHIAFWNANEIIRENNFLMSKDPRSLTENIGMGDGRGVQKALRQVCSSMSDASVNFVLEQYERLKVRKPLFIRIFKRDHGEKTLRKRSRSEILQRVAATDAARFGLSSKRFKKPDAVVGQRVAMTWAAGKGSEECYFGTVQARRLVLGREIYDVVFDKDNSTFSYILDDVLGGITTFGKRKREFNSRIIDIESISNEIGI